MKLKQLNEDHVKLARVTRRYQYLADHRIKLFGSMSIEIDAAVVEGLNEVKLEIWFFLSPWRTTALDKDDSPGSQEVRQDVVNTFVEQFAEKHGIPYTYMECSYRQVSVRYFFEEIAY